MRAGVRAPSALIVLVVMSGAGAQAIPARVPVSADRHGASDTKGVLITGAGHYLDRVVAARQEGLFLVGITGNPKPPAARVRLFAHNCADWAVGEHIGAVARTFAVRRPLRTELLNAEGCAKLSPVSGCLSQIFRGDLDPWRGTFGGERIGLDFDCEIGAERSDFLVARHSGLLPSEPSGGRSGYERQYGHEEYRPVVGVAALLVAVGLFGQGVWHAIILVQRGRTAYCLAVGWLLIGGGFAAFWFGMSSLRPLSGEGGASMLVGVIPWLWRLAA